MEGYSRDLLRGIGRGGDKSGREQKPPVKLEAAEEEEVEVELSLGLSLGGRFGLDRKGGKLARSSSVASVLAPEAAALAPPALARTSSLPTNAEAEAVSNRRREEWADFRGDGFVVEPPAKLPGSGSPSSGSSDGEGQRIQVNVADTLMRTGSLPAGIEDEWRKRKEAQSLKRLEVKRKRLGRRNSLTSNVCKEAAGQILEEMNTKGQKIEISNDVDIGTKQPGNLKNSNDKHHLHGLPPTHQAKFTSQHKSLAGMPKMASAAPKGTRNTEEHKPSAVPAVPPPPECMNGMLVPPPSSASAVITAAIGPRGELQHVSGRFAARAKSMGDAERAMQERVLQEMPCVCTKGLPNGRRVEGFLYKYRKGEEVRIVCVCHGSFLTPAEFVKHAGGGDVPNPLRHIVMSSISPSIF